MTDDNARLPCRVIIARQFSESVKVIFGQRLTGKSRNFILTDCEGETSYWKTYDFHRNVSDSGKLLGNDALADLRDASKTRITYDGNDVKYNQAVAAGMHVISMSLTNSANAASAGSLGNDRGNCRWGGVRYGEVLIFTNVLSDVRRQAVIDYLNHKWRGTASDAISPRSFALAGGTLDFGASVTELAKDATLAFTFDETGTACGRITAAGAYALPTHATVTVTCPAGVRPRGVRVPLVEAGALSGSVEGWTLQTSGLSRRARLRRTGNAVYLCLRGGLVVTFR